MHKTSYDEMKSFIKYMESLIPRKRIVRVLDVGSYSVNGSYKDLITREQWEYTGYDVREGPNVDIVGGAYDWPITSGSYDIVISGQCMEHVGAPWRWIKEVKRVLKVCGYLCIIAPHTYKYHPVPVDCWRVFPEGMKSLANDGGLDSSISVQKLYTTGNDTCMVAKKIS